MVVIMRFSSLFIYLLFFFQFSTLAHGIVQTTGNFLTKKQVRILKYKKNATAYDDSGEFIFKRPRSLKLIDDGSFFLIDNGKVLKFGKDGSFEKTIVRKGQGPAEATYLFQLYKRNRELVVNTGLMGKLMVFDFNGNLKAEYRQRGSMRETTGGFSIGEWAFFILGHTKNSDFIVNAKETSSKADRKNNKKNYLIMLLSKENEWKKTLFQIPVKALYFKTISGVQSIATHDVPSVFAGEYIYFCNTERYEVKRYNIEENKTDAIFKRKYTPVLIPQNKRGIYEWGETFTTGTRGGKIVEHKAPQREDFIDIQNLLWVNGHLWVVTSTVDNERGVLVDVYDESSTYIDSFYLCLNGEIDFHRFTEVSIRSDGSQLIVRETDVEGNFKVVKYVLPASR